MHHFGNENSRFSPAGSRNQEPVTREAAAFCRLGVDSKYEQYNQIRKEHL
jgi:hypothetical protein